MMRNADVETGRDYRITRREARVRTRDDGTREIDAANAWEAPDDLAACADTAEFM